MSFFSSPPKPQAPPPAPPPQVDPGIGEREDELAKRRQRRSATILTGTEGATLGQTAGKSLLGA